MSDQRLNAPWDEYRRQFPMVPTIRVIDVTAGTDEFKPLLAQPDFGELVLDGATMIVGLEHGLEWGERQALIQRFDDAWRERRANQEAHRRR